MAVQFKPKPGKPHIRITVSDGLCFLWPDTSSPEYGRLKEKACDYCLKVNPLSGGYSSKGDSARALHYGSENK